MSKHHVTFALAWSFIFIMSVATTGHSGSTKHVPPASRLTPSLPAQQTSTRQQHQQHATRGEQTRAPAAVTPAGSALIFEYGDIESHLQLIAFGSEDDEVWSLPSSNEMQVFAAAMASLLAGDYEQSAQSAVNIGFELIQFTDPDRGTFYILRDTPNADDISPGGTYVWKSQAQYPLIVEVPHPRLDTHTNKEGIELFLSADASMLLLAGTHRNSDLIESTCDGASSNDYRRSDPAHAGAHFFHVAHEQVENTLFEPLYIQFHGFGSSAYKSLSKQCGHSVPGSDPQLLVNVSDTYRDTSGDGAPPPGSFARTLSETINAEGTIKACLYNEDTSIYGGTLNMQGRYTNGSVDPCDEYALANNGRFIHLEQSYNTRRYQRPLMVSLIITALETYLGY